MKGCQSIYLIFLTVTGDPRFAVGSSSSLFKQERYGEIYVVIKVILFIAQLNDNFQHCFASKGVELREVFSQRGRA